MASSGAVCWLLLQHLFPLSLLYFSILSTSSFFFFGRALELVAQPINSILSIRHTHITYIYLIYIILYIFVVLGHFVFYGHILAGNFISCTRQSNSFDMRSHRSTGSSFIDAIWQFARSTNTQIQAQQQGTAYTAHKFYIPMCVSACVCAAFVCTSFSELEFSLFFFFLAAENSTFLFFKQLNFLTFSFHYFGVVSCRQAYVLIISYAR